MLLIRRFEERSSELYATGAIAGFLHARARRGGGGRRGARGPCDRRDAVLSTFRAHAHALARGTPTGAVHGRADGPVGRDVAAAAAARRTSSIPTARLLRRLRHPGRATRR